MVKKLKIICSDGELRETPIHAEFGMIAVTDSIQITQLDSYCVTHKVLGVKIRTFNDLKLAIEAARAWQGFDWEFSMKDQAHIADLQSLMKATSFWDKGF